MEFTCDAKCYGKRKTTLVVPYSLLNRFFLLIPFPNHLESFPLTYYIR